MKDQLREIDPGLSETQQEVYKSAVYTDFQEKAKTRAFDEKLKDLEYESRSKIRPLSFAEVERDWAREKNAIMDRDYGPDGSEQQLRDLIGLGDKYNERFTILAADGNADLEDRRDSILSDYRTSEHNTAMDAVREAVDTMYGDVNQRAKDWVNDMMNSGRPIPSDPEMVVGSFMDFTPPALCRRTLLAMT